MRQMLDSVSASSIPVGTQVVAGYVDGRYRWGPNDWARHHSAIHVPIAVFADTDDGLVLDVERGDATPAQVPGWVGMRRRRGVTPWVYCSSGLIPQVRGALANAGLHPPLWWVADWNGHADVPVGCVAHQYAAIGPYDLSALLDRVPGLDAMPPVSAPWPGLYLRVGSYGHDVALVQQAVGVLADGMFGPITEGAVRLFQRQHGLSPDGIVGPLTWAQMFP
jgi:hypothetical protein